MICKGKGKPNPRRLAMIAVALIIFAAVTVAQAASSMTVSHYHNAVDSSVHVIKVAAVAHTDGTFDSKQITEAAASAGLTKPYYQMGYYLYEVWAVNPATGYPTVAAAVTITDETGAAILASGELALSTSASGIAEASLGKFRAITSKLTVTAGDTGTAANTFDLYIKLVR